MARVGSVKIGIGAIGHWASVIARGESLPGLAPDAKQSPRLNALGFLIWSVWAKGEASARGVGVSPAEARGALQRDIAGFMSRAEFEGSLRASGETVSDIELQLETELAVAALRRSAARAAPAVTPREVASYYACRCHAGEFRGDETREFEIVNHLTLAAARRLVREAAQRHALPVAGLHESLTRNHMLHTTADKRAIERAIFATRQGSVGGPVRLFGFYSVFLLRRISPSTIRPLAAVRSAIEQKLTAARRTRAFAQFTRRLAERWQARTSCRAGYIVAGCRQSSSRLDVASLLAKTFDVP